VVELELLERGERTIPFLGQLEPAALEVVKHAEPVVHRRRIAEERPRDHQDGGDCEQRAESERERHVPAGTEESA
jgi:hypothetical protein